MKEIVRRLELLNKTISTMESCTGGAVASEITNVEGSSNVLKFSAVTYSNEYKIKMGVDENVINEYTVYSKETAREMAKNISSYTNSNIGVGITGQLNRIDPANPVGKVNEVYISIYDKDLDKYYDEYLQVNGESRKDNKEQVINRLENILLEVL